MHAALRGRILIHTYVVRMKAKFSMNPVPWKYSDTAKPAVLEYNFRKKLFSMKFNGKQRKNDANIVITKTA